MIRISEFLKEPGDFVLSPVSSNWNIVGWQSLLLEKESRRILGGGWHSNIEISKQIALAESIERKSTKQIRQSKEDSKLYCLDSYASSCGFAVGFQRSPTKIRSICEAVERWSLSQWIDGGHPLNSLAESAITLDPIASELRKVFSDCQFYCHPFNVHLDHEAPIQMELGVCIAFSGAGVFLGSRVAPSGIDVFSHAVEEAWQHYQIYLKRDKLKADDLRENKIYERIIYFGENRMAALKEIERAQLGTNRWFMPRIHLHRELFFDSKNVFGFRTLCDGYVPWNLGAKERFIY